MQTRKRPTNLSIRPDLLEKARALNINLSTALENHLEDLIARRERELWLENNRKAIEVYNSYIEQHGTFSDEIRKF